MSVHRKIDATHIHCHLFTAQTRLVISERQEALCEIIVILGGVHQAQYKDRNRDVSFSAKAGEVVLWPANTWRLEFNDPKSPLHCVAIYFRNPQMNDLPRRVSDSSGLIRILAQRLIEIKAQNLTKDREQEHYAAFMNAILAEYFRIAQSTGDTLVQRVTHFIEDNMARPFSLSDLARAMGLEPHHFGRRYKQLTGRTPMDQVRRNKAAHARDILLTAPKRPLSAVCASVGIANPKRLIRLIHRYTGVRVRELRRRG